MKRLNKIISIIITFAIIMGCVVTAPVANATAGDHNYFKSGHIVQCGDYVYFTDTDGELHCGDSDGKNIVNDLDEGISTPLFAVGDKIYYQVDDDKQSRIVELDTTTDEAPVIMFCPDEERLLGVFSKGLIIRENDYIYIRDFDTRFIKRIRAVNQKKEIQRTYMGSTDEYIFFTHTVMKEKKGKPVYKTSLIRYNVKTGNTKDMGRFDTSKKLYYLPYSVDFHAYDKCLVFTFGSFEASSTFYGNAYTMKADGTKIKKLAVSGTYSITQGKNCVYIQGEGKPSEKNTVKVSANGKVKKIKNKKAYYTVNNFGIYMKQVGKSYNYNLLRCNLNGTKSKTLLKAKSQISSNNSEKFAIPNVLGSMNDFILVEYDIMRFAKKGGFKYLKDNLYLVNVTTGKKIHIESDKY